MPAERTRGGPDTTPAESTAPCRVCMRTTRPCWCQKAPSKQDKATRIRRSTRHSQQLPPLRLLIPALAVKAEQQSPHTTGPPPVQSVSYLSLDEEESEGSRGGQGTDPCKWRHPAELEYIEPRDWDEGKIINYLCTNAAFSIPPREPLTASFPWVKVSPREPNDGPITLPRGYRIPLMFAAKFMWESLKFVLESPTCTEDWEECKFDILHVARLCSRFLAEAKKAGEVTGEKEKDRKKKGGMTKTWRCATFDRTLIRYYRRWLVSREEFVRDFWIEFDEEEFEVDVLKRDWTGFAMKGHKGFHLTRDEIQNGISFIEFTNGLTYVNERWSWNTSLPRYLPSARSPRTAPSTLAPPTLAPSSLAPSSLASSIPPSPNPAPSNPAPSSTPTVPPLPPSTTAMDVDTTIVHTAPQPRQPQQTPPRNRSPSRSRSLSSSPLSAAPSLIDLELDNYSPSLRIKRELIDAGLLPDPEVLATAALKQEYIDKVSWILAHPDPEPGVEYHRAGAPERPIVIRDPGTPAAYPSPVSDVEMDMDMVGDANNSYHEQTPGALGLTLGPAPASASNLDMEQGVSRPTGHDGSAGLAQEYVAAPADVEMADASTELGKSPEPEPEPEPENEEGSLRTATETRSSAASNVSTQEVVEMCLEEGQVDTQDEGGKSKAAAESSTAAGEEKAAEKAGVEEIETSNIISADKFILLRDQISIPCGPDLPAYPSSLPTSQLPSVTPVSPTRFLLRHGNSIFLGPRPLPAGYSGPAYSRPEQQFKTTRTNDKTGSRRPPLASTPSGSSSPGGASMSASVSTAPTNGKAKAAPGQKVDHSRWGERVEAARHNAGMYARSQAEHTQTEEGADKVLNDATHYVLGEIFQAFADEGDGWAKEVVAKKKARDRAKAEKVMKERYGGDGVGTGTGAGAEDPQSNLGKRKREDGDEAGNGSGKKKAVSSDGEKPQPQVQAVIEDDGSMQIPAASISPPATTPIATSAPDVQAVPSSSEPADITMGGTDSGDTTQDSLIAATSAQIPATPAPPPAPTPTLAPDVQAVPSSSEPVDIMMGGTDSGDTTQDLLIAAKSAQIPATPVPPPAPTPTLAPDVQATIPPSSVPADVSMECIDSLDAANESQETAALTMSATVQTGDAIKTPDQVPSSSDNPESARLAPQRKGSISGDAGGSVSGRLGGETPIPDWNVGHSQPETSPAVRPVTPGRPASVSVTDFQSNSAFSLPEKPSIAFPTPLQPHPNSDTNLNAAQTPSVNNLVPTTPKSTPKPKPQYTKSWTARVAAAMESARHVRVRGPEGDGDVDGFLEMMERLKVPEHEHEHEHEPSRFGEKTQNDDFVPGATSAPATIDSMVPPVISTPPSSPAPAASSGDTAKQMGPLDADRGQRRTVMPESTITAQQDGSHGVDVGVSAGASEIPDERMTVDSQELPMSTDVHVQTDPEEQPQRETTSTEQKGSDDGSSALPGTTAETGFVEGDIVTDKTELPSSAYLGANSLLAVATSHQHSKTTAEKAVQKEDSVRYTDVGTVTTVIAEIAVDKREGEKGHPPVTGLQGTTDALLGALRDVSGSSTEVEMDDLDTPSPSSHPPDLEDAAFASTSLQTQPSPGIPTISANLPTAGAAITPQRKFSEARVEEHPTMTMDPSPVVKKVVSMFRDTLVGLTDILETVGREDTKRAMAQAPPQTPSAPAPPPSTPSTSYIQAGSTASTSTSLVVVNELLDEIKALRQQMQADREQKEEKDREVMQLQNEMDNLRREIGALDFGAAAQDQTNDDDGIVDMDISPSSSAPGSPSAFSTPTGTWRKRRFRELNDIHSPHPLAHLMAPTLPLPLRLPQRMPGSITPLEPPIEMASSKALSIASTPVVSTPPPKESLPSSATSLRTPSPCSKPVPYDGVPLPIKSQRKHLVFFQSDRQQN